MTRDQIKSEMKDILEKGQFMSLSNIIDINEDTSLINDLALDSIQILELIVVMEKKFMFASEPDELNIDMFDNFGELISFIERKINEKEKIG